MQVAFSADERRTVEQPYYLPGGNEIEVFEAAHRQRLPLMLKGPTGCGKTRLIEHMATRLGVPLITIACHEDITAADLVGRYLLHGGETVWADGPLTRAVRRGALKAGGLRTLVGSIEQRQRFLVLEVERCCERIADRLPTDCRGRS